MIRMNVNRILPLMLLLVLFASCSRKYKVEGVSSVTSLDGKMLYLKTLRDGQWIAIDSAEVVHGLFSTSGPSDSVMMVTLYMNDEAIMPLVLENGKIEVSISNSQLTAKGTPLNNALYEFIEKRNSLELKIEELEKTVARLKTELQKSEAEVAAAKEKRTALYAKVEEIQQELQKAVLKLPERQRLVFNMKYFDDMKYEDIAEVLDVAVGTLKATYHNAVKKIEESLKISDTLPSFE